MTFNSKDNNLIYLVCMLLSLIGIIIYASFDSLIVMEQKWGAKEEYGYAYMIPFITIYFIWQRLEPLSEVKFEFSLTGFSLLCMSLFFLLLGTLSATHTITQYGAILSIISVFYLFLGHNAMRVIGVPLLLLLLIIPLPVFLFNTLSGFLQLISSELGVWFIRLFDISVYLEGNVIDLGVYKLQVVEACSGLNYLFPLFSLTVIAAFVYKAVLWKKIVIVLSSAPITVFMNSFRIGVIGVLVEYRGIEQAEGFLHDFEGWIIFMVCTVLIVIEMWLLLKIGSGTKKLTDAFSLEAVDHSNLSFQSSNFSYKQIVLIIFIVVFLIFISSIDERKETIPERESFETFPLSIEQWEGRRTILDDNVLDALQLNDYIMADYINDKGEIVNFYVAYYESQRSGQAAHSPKSCIPGGGWEIASHNVANIAEEGTPANRLLVKKGGEGLLTYYWFLQRGRLITNEYLVKWYLFMDALLTNRSDGSLVRVTTSLSEGESEILAEKRLLDFYKNVRPNLSRFIPE